MIIEIFNKQEKERIARKILADLPEWFGLPESTENYIKESQELPFLASMDEGEAVGFAALQQTGPRCADIFVMGVLKSNHRRGVGRALHAALEALARARGYLYLQVKTVQMGHYPEYDRSNRFYQAMGFAELECFPTLWDEWNPCQIYVKYIGG